MQIASTSRVGTPAPSSSTTGAMARLRNARLPRWALPQPWSEPAGQPALADICIQDGRVAGVYPADHAPLGENHLDAAGAPVLPGLLEAHAHLDKTFTLPRMGRVEPGLLGAIESMLADRATWTADDVRQRAEQGLQWAWEAGVVRMRTHCDWWEADKDPVAWQVLRELADRWAGRIALDRAALVPLGRFTDAAQARSLARRIAAEGSSALLGAFIHSHNWDRQAMRHLIRAAADEGLRLDLHIDEELNPQAAGLATLATLLDEIQPTARIVCGHGCALAQQDEAQALATLDRLARHRITLVSLPATNLLLQDATEGRTPRRRGLTLVQEARDRGIPVLLGSDNVQDPFCPMGDYDPLQALGLGLLSAQLGDAFDTWSAAICRHDWLDDQAGPALSRGARADFVIFPLAGVAAFPARTQRRTVLRDGVPLDLATA